MSRYDEIESMTAELNGLEDSLIAAKGTDKEPEAKARLTKRITEINQYLESLTNKNQ